MSPKKITPADFFYPVFVGIDGCGKDTQIKLAKDYLKSRGYKVFSAVEPTGGPFGIEARKILKNEKDPYEGALKCLDIFLLDRKDNLMTNIIPAIERGEIPLQNRGNPCTFAYQAAQGIPIADIEKAYREVLGPRLRRILSMADIFYFDITPEESVRRGKKGEKFEKAEFLGKVRENYLMLDKVLPNRIFKIDGMPPEEEVFNQVEYHLDSILK